MIGSSPGPDRLDERWSRGMETVIKKGKDFRLDRCTLRFLVGKGSTGTHERKPPWSKQ